MADTNTITNAESSAPVQDAGFDERHKKELGVGQFAKVSAFNSFLPLIMAAAGAAIGYFALAKPAAMALPKKLTKGLGAVEALGEGAWKGIEGLLRNGTDYLAGDQTKALEKLKGMFNTSGENAQKILTVIKGDATKHEKLVQIAETLGRPLPAVPKTVKLSTTGIMGFLGLTGGSVTIGYKEWRKKESSRLAAEEINRDIAGMELFKPSDAELVAENKRLRTMVAALPTIDPASVQSQGRVEDREMKPALG